MGENYREILRFMATFPMSALSERTTPLLASDPATLYHVQNLRNRDGNRPVDLCKDVPKKAWQDVAKLLTSWKKLEKIQVFLILPHVAIYLFILCVTYYCDIVRESSALSLIAQTGTALCDSLAALNCKHSKETDEVKDSRENLWSTVAEDEIKHYLKHFILLTSGFRSRL